MEMVPETKQAIIKLFYEHYKYRDIINILSRKYNVDISFAQLKKFLRKHHLRRRNLVESPDEEIVAAIKLELEDSGMNLGYRAMWQRLIKRCKLKVKQKTVLEAMRAVDPEGVEARKRHRLKRRQYSVEGPNSLWHGDGYDKLKRYGFAIHGCIDGFSKRVIWLKVATSNNDPKIITWIQSST